MAGSVIPKKISNFCPDLTRLFVIYPQQLLFHLKKIVMKDFMFIFRGGLDPMTASPEDMQDNMQKWFGWVEDLKQRNIYASGEALHPGGSTVRTQNVVTDGPFAESKEIVGGFFVVKAKSLEEALELAKDCPDLPLGGSVEVREVMKF